MNHALPHLIRITQATRDQQAARSAQARQATERAAATLEQLRQFRQECLARQAGGSSKRTHGGALQDHQHFVARLDETIVLQAQEVRRQALQADQQQQVLQRCQQRLLALEALRERAASAAATRAARREQHDADAFAARAHTQLAWRETA